MEAVNTENGIYNGLLLGIDIGSTTAKVVLLDGEKTVYEKYERHYSSVREKIREMLTGMKPLLGDRRFLAAISGSAGMGLAADASDADIAAEMERIALNEIENARRTIPVTLEDSRIGFEPTMDYTADEIRLNWKIGVTHDSIERLYDYMRNL